MAGERDPALGYLQSLCDGDNVSLCIADSTPNGPQGWFYRTYVQENDWEKIFAAWFEFEDSTVPFRTKLELKDFKESLTRDEEDEMKRFDVTWENMHWRRKTLRDKCNGDVNKFRQEYPSDPDECFLLSSRPRFNVQIVEEMRKSAKGQIYRMAPCPTRDLPLRSSPITRETGKCTKNLCTTPSM
jgi:hypothetical protein